MPNNPFNPIAAKTRLRVNGTLGVRITMSFDYSDPPLTTEERIKIDSLTAAQIQTIDDALMRYASEKWRKMARLVGSAILDLDGVIQSVPDGYYAERVRALVRSGALEYQGDLQVMRYCEVRRVANH